MEPVNVFLGVGIVLVLTALLGQIEAFSVKVAPVNSPLRRVVVGCLGVALVVGAYVLPLPGDADREDRDEVSAYQAQVLATCDRLSAILASGEDALDLEMNADGTLVVRRDQLVQLVQRQLTERSAALDALWDRVAPTSLTEEVQTARALAEEGLQLGAQLLTALGGLPARFPQAQIDVLAAGFEAQSPGHASRTNAAFASLAGGTCTAAG